MWRAYLLLSILVVLSLIGLSSCSLSAQNISDEVLRIGTLTIVKALPLYVAESEGFFDAEGARVEITTFGSAQERDAALQAGAIDGASMDLIAVALLNDGGFPIQAVSVDNPDGASFGILSAPASDIQSPQDLRGVPIAVSTNTIIEFVTSQLLLQEGLTEEDLIFTEVSRIPVRMEMLAQGQVQAATLPEPMVSLAEAQGAHLIINDTAHHIPPTVIAFRTVAIGEKHQQIEAFIRAFERAIQSINTNPEEYRELFVEKAGIPESLRDSYPIPQFHSTGVPTEEDVAIVIEWLLSRELIADSISYEIMVDGTFTE